MTDVSDDVFFTVEVADGVELTFDEFMIVVAKSDYIILGIVQIIGEGDDAEYVEVTSIDIDYKLSSGDNNDTSTLSLWDRIVIFFKDLIQKIEIFFLNLTSK